MKSYDMLNERPLMPGSSELNSISGLINYIISVHHGFFKKGIPVLTDQLINVVLTSGDKYPEMQKINILFGVLVKEIGILIEKELVLFPRIAAMQKQTMTGAHEKDDVFNLKDHIKVFEEESNQLKGIMAQIRTLTHNYTYPSNASAGHNLVLASLEMLEINLYRHLYLGNMLFVKASLF